MDRSSQLTPRMATETEDDRRRIAVIATLRIGFDAGTSPGSTSRASHHYLANLTQFKSALDNQRRKRLISHLISKIPDDKVFNAYTRKPLALIIANTEYHKQKIPDLDNRTSLP